MSASIFELKHIFGLKLRDLRQEKQLTYQELSKQSELSVSYLSEIESGKKYPKADKILKLAEALDTTFEEMVSSQVSEKLQPVIEFLDSWILKDFPLEKFGLNPQKILEIISQDPVRTSAFIKSILHLALKYDVKPEQFYGESLRSYIELSENYFPEVEEIVESLRTEYANVKLVPFQPKSAEKILLDLGVRTNYQEIPKRQKLKHLRSLFDKKKRILYVNQELTDGQNNFLIGREIAFQSMKMKKRPIATPWPDTKNFEELLNNYEASYFAAALVMPRKKLIDDLRSFFANKKWDPTFMIGLLRKYKATPEMLMQRLTTILSSEFGLKNLFLLRFLHTQKEVTLTKELHLSSQKNPYANEISEHYCRRMLGVRVFGELISSSINIIADAQVSTLDNSDKSYFAITIGFQNISNQKEYISVTIGVLFDEHLKEQTHFLDDEKILRAHVGNTCERCSIKDCKERVSNSIILEQREKANEFRNEIEKILVE